MRLLAAGGAGGQVDGSIVLDAMDSAPEPHGLRVIAQFPASSPDLDRWAALILEEAPGRTVPRLPFVTGLTADLFRAGEPATLSGDGRWVELPMAEGIGVVTVFVERADGRILLLRRSAQVGSFRGRWAGVSGFLEGDIPSERARREIEEETGYGGRDVELAVAAPPIYARDGDRVFEVHPFRFRVGHDAYRLDWEHTEAAWVDPSEIGHRLTVPHLDRAWNAVAPGKS